MECMFCNRECGEGSRGTCDRCTNWGSNVDPTAVIGRPPQHRDWPPHKPGFVPIIHPDCRIEALCTVDAGRLGHTRLGACWLMKMVHVGHDVVIGDGAELAPMTSVGGHVVIGANVKIGQGVTFKPFVNIGDGARIGMGAVVLCDVPEGEVWAGNPARKLR